MSVNNRRELSLREAFATIGLHPKDDTMYFLANLIIEISVNSLRITKVSGSISSEPEDTYETDEPFIYTHNGRDYILRVENGDLKVYEQQPLIGGTLTNHNTSAVGDNIVN